MTIPHVGLSIVDIHMGDEVWARITGLLALSLGIIAFTSAKHNYLLCIQHSVWLRYFSCAFIIFMLLLGKFELPLLAFGIIDGLGAT